MIKDALYGFIIGDIYGLSILSVDDYKDSIKLNDNNILNIEKGNYSSMTVFMLATIDSIIKNKNVNTLDILNKMCASLIVGKYTSDGKVYDIDNNTLNILKHYSKKNNLNIEYNELDKTTYALSRILPVILYDYYKESNIDNLINTLNITNINDDVLLGSYIYYNYIHNLLFGYDKYKALKKIEIPKTFKTESIEKFNKILNNNLYYKELKHDNNIVDVLSIVFYVILNSNNFNDIFMMLDNIEGCTNIYGSLICSIGGILYGINNVDKNITKYIKNKKNINKYIKGFERILEK